MKTLSNFISKSVGGFSTTFDNPNDAINFINDCRIKKNKEELSEVVKEFINYLYNDLWKKESMETFYTPLRCNYNGEIKLCRHYEDYWINEIESEWNIENTPSKEFKIDNFTIKWGNGSVYKSDIYIPTDIHEEISVRVFNEFNFKYDKISISILRNEFNWGEYEEYKFYSYRIGSWVEQFNTIKNFLKWNNSNLVAVKCGDDKDEIGVLFKEVNEKIRVEKNTKNINNFNPSDMFIYNRTYINEIKDGMKKILNNNTNTSFITTVALLSRLYKEQKFVGVSLKNGHSFMPIMLNVEPIKGFENAKLSDKINYDPCEMFFRGMDFSKIKRLNKNFYKKHLHKKTIKTLTLKIDTDDSKGIELQYRTNHDGYRSSLILEPKLKNAKSFIGKCPARKYRNYLDIFNIGFKELGDTVLSKVNYNIDDLCYKWDFIKESGIINAKSTSNDIRKLFDIVGEIEKITNGELYSYYMQINFLYALININKDKKEETIGKKLRNILLWSEKLDEDCLPYLLIKPKM